MLFRIDVDITNKVKVEMISKKQKEEIVEGLVEKFEKASGFYFVDYMGMTVDDAIAIRRDLKEKDIDYQVAKNTLLKIAIEKVGDIELPEENFKGPTAVVFGYEDPVAPSRIIKDHFDKNELPKLKSAWLEGEYFDSSKLKELADLPTKDDVMASIVGSIHAPISGIVGSINAVMRDVAYLVEEVAKKQNES